MRELPGVNELHRGKFENNPRIREIIRFANKTKDPKPTIDYLSGAKDIIENSKDNNTTEHIEEEER